MKLEPRQIDVTADDIEAWQTFRSTDEPIVAAARRAYPEAKRIIVGYRSLTISESDDMRNLCRGGDNTPFLLPQDILETQEKLGHILDKAVPVEPFSFTPIPEDHPSNFYA